jgi:glucan phosphoethanolaminetransferase (alkaline phosphatase superfamily)
LALNQRVRAGLGSWLPPVCANSFGTLISVPLLLTAIPPERHDEADTAPSVIAILKDAGFSTALIDNQGALVFQEEGHDLYWDSSDISRASGSFDEKMVPIASAFAGPLTAPSSGLLKPRAMMLHMLGSHFEYIDRYPSNLFPPEPTNLTQDELVELRYDRSEEYSAKVLGELADLLDRSTVPAFLVFTSDHGENLPGDHNGLRSHLGPRASIQDGTVPAIILWNKTMGQTGRPEKVLKLLEKPPMIAHVDVSRAFLALAGMMDGPIVPALDPKILAPVVVGGPGNTVNSCSLLKP